MAGSLTDISLRKRAEERLLHDALHDALTHLPNRTLFLDRLGVAMARARRKSEDSVGCSALLFLDVDRFKHVNDSLGHLAGDSLLLAMARRLVAILRPGDTVARLGGDEFAILVDISRTETAEVLAQRIHKELAVPFELDGHEVLATVSIGISAVQGNHRRPEDIRREADIAMYEAKMGGRAGSRVFDQQMHTRAAAMFKFESDLSQAAERRELLLHYQPVISFAEDRIAGFEALLRWQHPERGLILPEEIISVAEDTGLIVQIGTWVMEEACGRMVQWQAQHEMTRDLSMSINFSSQQVMQPDLVETIVRVLDQSGLSPSCLRLELTESVIMDNAESVVAKLSQLRSLGVQVHVDDFGTGYSSLSYLQRLPVDTLKIDRSFVAQIGIHNESVEIVSAIITLARNLGMSVAAEGVETAETGGRPESTRLRVRAGLLLLPPSGKHCHRGPARQLSAENTILVFLTDNGSTFGTLYFNAGMRGRKTELWEGGHRVPLFIRWPGGGLGRGRDVEGLTQVQDLLPTLIDLAGFVTPAAPRFDGISLAPVLRGQAVVTEERMLVVNYSRMPFWARLSVSVQSLDHAPRGCCSALEALAIPGSP